MGQPFINACTHAVASYMVVRILVTGRLEAGLVQPLPLSLIGCVLMDVCCQ
jgi:hypothetical protein